VKVKICGITSLGDASMCEDLGADALGFVYYRGRMRSLPLAKISEICASIGPLTTKVLVCAPGNVAEAIDMLEGSSADVLQLYSLRPEDMTVLRDRGIPIFRTVPPERSEAIRFSQCADALVFENGAPGLGRSYDYARVPIDCCPRAFIAGGLTTANLHLAKAMNPYGLDVSSGVESAPGKKDPALVSEFIRRCKA